MTAERQDADQAKALLALVHAALAANSPLRIAGGGSKAFYGRTIGGEVLDVRAHRGIVSYDPAELVVTVRAGTPLADLRAALDAAGQTLACEPPDFNGAATVGGMVAAGLSGPRRPWVGAVRDFVLGCRIITGQGKHLRFGGEVIKNVAGYDVSRLMAGSLGCLGLITEVSFRVLPKPRAAVTLRLEAGRADALRKFAAWGRQSLPIAGACHDGEAVILRLEGGESSVKAAREMLGGEVGDAAWWRDLRDHRLGFFRDARPLWRLSVAATRTPTKLPGDALVDWAGAQVWLKSAAAPGEIQTLAASAGGHATCFTPGIVDTPFAPQPPALLRYHRQLKARLDPQGIFNPGRLAVEF